MNPRTSRCFTPRRCLSSPTRALSAAVATLGALHAWAADPPPQILEARVQAQGLLLAWTGQAWSYAVQRTTGLGSADWPTILTTARTNAVVPAQETTAFFRIAAVPRVPSQITLMTTNVQTGDSVTFGLQPQTSADLIFNGPTNVNGFDLQKLILRESERQKFDLLFDGAGGFTVLTNGVPAALAGQFDVVAGPGAGEVTYAGVLTHASGTFTFSAVNVPGMGRRNVGLAGNEPALQSAGTGGGGHLGLSLEGLIGAMQWLICLPSFAGQQLGCTGECAAQALACAFQFPPKASYCNFVTEIVWEPGQALPDCRSRCEHGCK